ncbi:MAG: type IX secretion system membrane protein PorP/SprF [Flavobacteriaceae bacterium]
MNRIKLFSFITTVLFFGQSYAQQDASFSFYNYNMNIINPAYVGTGDRIEFTSTVRSQWVGLEGAPELQSFSLAFPVGPKIGVGLSVTNSNVSVLHETDITLDFSYRLQLKEKLDLFLGLKALGGSIIDIDLASLGIVDDPIFTENITTFNPSFGVGALLKGEDFYINISTPNFLSSRRYEKDSGVVTEATDNLVFYAGAGYHLPLGSDDIIFTPSILTRMVSGTPLSADITGTVSIHDLLDVGINHRLNESIGGLVFFKMLDWIKLGYAYDGSISEIGNYSRGNHEVLLKLLL